jgi:hypothetical protein
MMYRIPCHSEIFKQYIIISNFTPNIQPFQIKMKVCIKKQLIRYAL